MAGLAVARSRPWATHGGTVQSSFTAPGAAGGIGADQGDEETHPKASRSAGAGSGGCAFSNVRALSRLALRVAVGEQPVVADPDKQRGGQYMLEESTNKTPWVQGSWGRQTPP